MTAESSGPRIVHFGLGNFHRAHQAWYTQLANSSAGESWRITGISPRSNNVSNHLSAQQWKYSMLIDDGIKPEAVRIAVHDSILVAPEHPEQIANAIADPATHIISFTITEKAYQPEATAPKGSWLELLAAGLAQRMADGGSGATLLCCDNLPANGTKLEKCVLDFLRPDAKLHDWVLRTCTFPCTMVDRIVPRTTDQLRARLHEEFGISDELPVQTEGFTQWVIEDKFASARPAWEAAGAELVADAAPYERMKLALLNGSHSFIAYAGLLRGYRYVDEAIADSQISADVCALWDEAAAVTPMPAGYDVHSYRQALLARYANASLQHQLMQIAMDGSQKIPVRLLPSLRACADAKLACPALQKAVAAWTAFCLHQCSAGQRLDDPMHDQIAAAAEHGAGALLAIEEIFGDLFVADPSLHDSVVKLAYDWLEHTK